MITLSKDDLIIKDPNYVEKIQADFRNFGFSKLSQFLSPDLQHEIKRALPFHQYSNFDVNANGDIGKEEVSHGHIYQLLNRLFNQNFVLKAFAPIANVPELKLFTGRHYIYRRPESKLRWHSDFLFNRCLTITINISPEYYLGGNLEFKPKLQIEDSPSVVAYNRFFGDAILFPVTGDQLHRLKPVFNGTKKIAFAGFFVQKNLLSPLV